MRCLFVLCLPLLLLLSCKKEGSSRVDIYLLKSFTLQADTTTTPYLYSITNAVLEPTPLVADKDIEWYKKATATFKLKQNIKPLIQHFSQDKAFAVTVDHHPVYYGRFQPAILSYLPLGLATIDPVFITHNELPIQFPLVEGNLVLSQLDKRNDPRILLALKTSGRVK